MPRQILRILRTKFSLLNVRILNYNRCQRLSLTTSSFQHQNYQSTEPQSDEPVRFSGSKADLEAADSFKSKSNAPPYQSPLVILSLTAFMVYFCILREENDIDENLGSTFYRDLDPGKEIRELQQQLAHEKKIGLDTTATEAKIMELIMLSREGTYGALKRSLKRVGDSVTAKDAAGEAAKTALKK